MSIVKPSFFVRNLNIPNTGTDKVDERLYAFIEKYEKECLLKLFGYPLYKQYVIETTGTVTSRMELIISGSEYSLEGNVFNWPGLLHDENISLLANYVYYSLQEDSATHTTGQATVVPKGTVVKEVSPAEKMIYSWNEFSEEAESLLSFLWFKSTSNIRLYPEFNSSQFWLARNFSRKINFMGL